MDCIFCKIVKGEIPASKVYEDDDMLVILDVGPVHEGHCLILPKDHHETLFETPDPLMEKIGPVMKKTTIAVKKATGCDGVNIAQNNYKAAGQLVPHLHFHVIPRYEGDGLKTWPQGQYEEGNMQKVAEKIRKNWD